MDTPELLVADVAAWRRWLQRNHGEPGGVWLVLAKKGTTDPTTLTYDQALEEALCHGWIDGQARRRDGTTCFQRFTPRRARSAWSQLNAARVKRLLAEGRMHPAGIAAYEQAGADGRLDNAYAGSATIEMPADLRRALDAEPRAGAFYTQLSSQNRYAILYRVSTAKRPETRAKRIAEYVAMLARGETLHPQRRRSG